MKTYSDVRGTKREQYERLRGALMLERSTFDNHWREISEYIRPRRTRFHTTDRNRGDRRNQRIIDSTATFAARTLQSGLHAGITSPARPWFRLAVPDPDLNEAPRVRQWLHDVTVRMQTVLLRSNLYNILPVTYGDTGLFASSAMSVLEDRRDLMRCYSYPLGSFALGVSERQVVDTFIRESQMTVRQIVEQFGAKENGEIDWSGISKTIKDLWHRGEYESAVDVCWVVAPNPDRDPNRLGAKYLPYASCYFEKGEDNSKKFLHESGFNEFPILAPRWDVTGEDIYGTESPGMNCLGDVKQLQLMQKRKAQAVEKMINPPVHAPVHVRNQKVSLLPGDISYVDVTQENNGIRPIHEVRMSVAEITQDIQDTRQLIRNAFYEPLFLMLATTDRREITAREIEERHEEKLLALGPVLERMNDELLDPLVDRVYAMMDRAGMIPPPPQELEGIRLKVEYISLMAQAQKLVGVVGADRFFGSVVPLIEAFPEIRFKLNPMQAVDDYADMLGVNPSWVVPDDEAQVAMDEARQAAANQQQTEQAGLRAKAARDLSQANLDGNTALTALVEGVQ